jgi:hypothetical protein
MAVTGYWYPVGGMAKMGSALGKFDWVADSASIKIALMNTNFTGASQSLSLASSWSDVSAYEIATFTGYTGVASNAGKTLGTTAVAAYSTSNKTVKFSGATSTVWTTATLTTRGAVVTKQVSATKSDCPVIFFLDFGADQAPSAGDFTITWHTDGMATITTA